MFLFPAVCACSPTSHTPGIWLFSYPNRTSHVSSVKSEYKAQPWCEGHWDKKNVFRCARGEYLTPTRNSMFVEQPCSCKFAHSVFSLDLHFHNPNNSKLHSCGLVFLATLKVDMQGKYNLTSFEVESRESGFLLCSTHTCTSHTWKKDTESVSKVRKLLGCKKT